VHDSPANGDLLITTEHGIHYLSIVPNPHRLSFKELERAIAIAKLWVTSQDVAIWHAHDGVVTNLRQHGSAA
jgi:hypothetical protein